MKIWYFCHNARLDYLVAFGNTPEEAFDRFLKSRVELIKQGNVDTDINNWEVEEFTSETYDGALFFY